MCWPPVGWVPEVAYPQRIRSAVPPVLEDADELVDRFLWPGARLHFASTTGRPGALAYAVARVWAGRSADFTVSCTALHGAMHALTMAGVVARAITCFAGDTSPTPRPNPLYAGLSRGVPFPVEEHSLLAFTQRLTAAATGQPYARTNSLYGSDLLQALPPGVVVEPADPPERPETLLTPLAPDITLVHGVCADQRGNIALVAPYGEGAWGALAAKVGVVATVERLVPEITPVEPERTVLIPAERVLGLAVAPFGAHPQGLRSGGLAEVTGYRDDHDFMAELARSCRDPDRAETWFKEWVLGGGGHRGYLAALGERRLAGLVGARAPRTCPVPPDPEVSAKQRLTVLAARATVDRVREHGYESLLAGIGISHLAAWLAAELLRRDHGLEVRVLAELGFEGMRPTSGDAFLFSQDHTETCQRLSGISRVLGGLVSGGGSRCLGVLSAAQVDQYGNVNTSRTADGSYLVGSGGANDVASVVDTVVVAAAGRDRYVDRVDFVTSPGQRVTDVVSGFGRFRRTSPAATFALATWLPLAAPGAGLSPREAVAQFTRWRQSDSPPVDEAPVRHTELAMLHRLDPDGHYR